MMNTQSISHCLLAFTAIAFLVGARSFGQAPVDGVATPPKSQAGSPEQDRLLQFVSIPSNALPKGVRLVQRVSTAPLGPSTHNPALLRDLEKIKRVAVFFGIVDKKDLQSVHAGVVAIYQDNDPSHEIGIYGLWFSDGNSAKHWCKKLKANSKGSPFFLEDRLLLFLWRDDGVSDRVFAAIGEYLKVAKLARTATAEQALLPDSANQIFGRIRPDMAEGEIEKLVQKYFPKAKAALGVWSGQTGYVEFKLTSRYSISVAEYNDPKDFNSRFVHADMILYLYDWKLKRRINISFHKWDNEKNGEGKTSEESRAGVLKAAPAE